MARSSQGTPSGQLSRRALRDGRYATGHIATPEEGMRGSHDGSDQDARGFSAKAPHGAQVTSSPSLLERAAAGWIRRGYTVRYRDPHLIQLVRRGRPGCSGWLLVVLALPLMGLAIALVVIGLRRRYWHTVSITATPDQRIITHRQWAPNPPEP
jgi:hypothetical protein